MNYSIEWYPVARSVLELLYFASGIGLLLAALFALKQVRLAAEQLKMTRDIANSNARREAVKLAADQCRYFAEAVVPNLTSVIAEYKKHRLTFLSGQQQPQQPPPFLLNNGEIVQANYDLKTITAEWGNISEGGVNYLNSVESFAIPFAAGVAADDVGFASTAAAFCAGVSLFMPAIYFLRQTQMSRYPSALKLFCVWNNRLAADALAPHLKALQAMIDAANRDKIKPI